MYNIWKELECKYLSITLFKIIPIFTVLSWHKEPYMQRYNYGDENFLEIGITVFNICICIYWEVEFKE